ncbi:MAG: branched-chain amino acid transaminase [Acidobacteriota bacterium]|nr:branched-chain amino acid transaminase [Acidobacteriota bacterium]
MFDNTYFPKAKNFWQSGKMYELSQPTIHSMTHALHYGTSVFEGIRAYKTSRGPAVFRLKEHLDRLFHSASILRMTVPYTKEEITEAIKLVVKENKLDSAYIRPLLFYSYGNLGLLPKACPVELTIGAWEWGAYLGDKVEKGVHACIVPWRRIHRSQSNMTAKLGGVYVQSAISGMEARSRGFDEALFLNIEGRVAEGPGENIAIIKNGVLKTNNNAESILEGITRSSLLEIAKNSGIETAVGPIEKEEFFNADEAFFCGTAVEVASIVRVTDASDPNSPEKEYAIGNGEFGAMTKKIKQTYLEVVTGQVPQYENWLTYVYD